MYMNTVYMYTCMYNDTSLVRPPLLRKKSGLSKWMASSGEEINIHVLIYIVQVAFPDGLPSRQ